MHYSNVIFFGLLTAGINSTAFAQDIPHDSNNQPAMADQPVIVEQKTSALKAIQKLTPQDLKVNASAAQPDAVKDPLEPLNRKIYTFNDALDRNVLKPIAIQYAEKIPASVRSPYQQFRHNLGEPWNAFNQLIQGRPVRATKTLGRFTLNTLTTLGFADPARRLGLETEEESLGVTLGYYGIHSGPYIVLPFFGPSTFRDGFGLAVDSFSRPQRYLLDNQDGLYWSTNVLQAIDTRANLLDLEKTLSGDKYAAIRDVYLQHQSFLISEKHGDSADVSFVDDEIDDTSFDEE